MKDRLFGVGIVVGRFQTPYLHPGHMAILERADRHEKMLVFVGVHRAPGSCGNELDYESRYVMINDAFPHAVILPIHDEPTDDTWTKKLDGTIDSLFPFSKKTLYHGRDSFAPHYSGKYKNNLIDIGEATEDNATELRTKCYERALNTEDFRHGVFYGASQRWPRINPTVDMAITRPAKDGSAEREILLGTKPGDSRGWRFPGGYIDRTDDSAEDAAIREVVEETKLEVSNPDYIGTMRIKDWRDTATNSTLTTFFHFEYTFGHAEAGDDLGEVQWFKLSKLDNTKMVSEHRRMLEPLKKFIENKYETKVGKEND